MNIANFPLLRCSLLIFRIIYITPNCKLMIQCLQEFKASFLMSFHSFLVNFGTRIWLRFCSSCVLLGNNCKCKIHLLCLWQCPCVVIHFVFSQRFLGGICCKWECFRMHACLQAYACVFVCVCAHSYIYVK